MAKEKRKRPSYKCAEFSECRLNNVFNIDISNDLPKIQPLFFCYLCERVMVQHITFIYLLLLFFHY